MIFNFTTLGSNLQPIEMMCREHEFPCKVISRSHLKVKCFNSLCSRNIPVLSEEFHETYLQWFSDWVDVQRAKGGPANLGQGHTWRSNIWASIFMCSKFVYCGLSRIVEMIGRSCRSITPGQGEALNLKVERSYLLLHCTVYLLCPLKDFLDTWLKC